MGLRANLLYYSKLARRLLGDTLEYKKTMPTLHNKIQFSNQPTISCQHKHIIQVKRSYMYICGRLQY